MNTQKGSVSKSVRKIHGSKTQKWNEHVEVGLSILIILKISKIYDDKMSSVRYYFASNCS